ncbi:MAG: tRNA pseudouridine(55) synthase TruB [Chloroflexi bacterium]|nr:MAG: tRNA pseudouridine(55) synthase TruB [Chloroflexota bacterium]RLT34020.1 MAG: tRNA pseudouridine(55) synthase TruB [Chloroflexota bacterium]
MHGFISIDKPLGITSHDVVAIVRRISRIKRIGHAGTLDPGASGVLVLAVGATTRLIEYVQDDTHKTYVATIQLGSATDSDDADGSVIAQAAVPELSEAWLLTTLAPFVGQILQVPPKVSAIHVDGQRMYDLARKGIAPELPARPVHIYHIALRGYTSDTISLEISCGKGTYIRSLARDIGIALGTLAHLCSLRRTAVGSFGVNDSVSLDTLRADGIAPWLLANSRALDGWPVYCVNAAEHRLIDNGMPIPVPSIADGRVAVVDATGELIATAESRAGSLHPSKVFRWSDAS